jgi:hypothetical protein
MLEYLQEPFIKICGGGTNSWCWSWPTTINNWCGITVLTTPQLLLLQSFQMLLLWSTKLLSAADDAVV